MSYSPPLLTVTIVPSATIVRLDKPLFVSTTRRVVIVPSRRRPLACLRVCVQTAELLAAFPTPGLTAAGSDDKGSLGGKAAGKNVITGSVFEAPSLTPGALFGVVGHDSSTASYKFTPPTNCAGRNFILNGTVYLRNGPT